jgi:hypothetical protein
MKAIKIKGRDYITVNERLKHFRLDDTYKGWNIIEDVAEINNNEIIVTVTIVDQDGQLRSKASSQEYRDSSMINKTSFLENAATSALGRALGYLGIGIDTSIASAEEMNQAVVRQNYITKQERNQPIKMRKLTDDQLNKLLEEGTHKQAAKVIETFECTPEQIEKLRLTFKLH